MHAEGSSDGPRQIVPGASQMLLLLVLINLFNYIDRQVLAAVRARTSVRSSSRPC
jgi:hypothetical protein